MFIILPVVWLIYDTPGNRYYNRYGGYKLCCRKLRNRDNTPQTRKEIRRSVQGDASVLDTKSTWTKPANRANCRRERERPERKQEKKEKQREPIISRAYFALFIHQIFLDLIGRAPKKHKAWKTDRPEEIEISMIWYCIKQLVQQ